MRKTGAVLWAFALLLAGCATYTTPGAGVQISTLAEADIGELMAREPVAEFPVNIAVARVQAPGYYSYRSESYGIGRYSIVTTRDVEKEEDFERLSDMRMVTAVAPLNRILLPGRLDTIKDIRAAAARLRADILLVYTFDTVFQVGAQKYGALNVVALGFLKNKEVTVTTTASAALFDVQTEFIYGLAEATAHESKKASGWGSTGAVDDLRVVTERQAFQSMLSELEKTWNDIIREHGTESAASSRRSAPDGAPSTNRRRALTRRA